eukprot:TRINITY_DN20881_c0_g1_i1.p1 TRINITY_DN20881_c0_g1~~TRINITY_DN20881_c0_g1_i1.p1  ORF type:complete len:302 (+),score=20.43 TRINITY_DN20881_c0_g1_i1:56-961(+)
MARNIGHICLKVGLLWPQAFAGRPRVLEGYQIHPNSFCFAAGGKFDEHETPDEQVVSAFECARKCDAMSGCVGFWHQGERSDKIHFCRYYVGLLARVGGTYENVDCYLRGDMPTSDTLDHDREAVGYVMHADSSCQVGGVPHADREGADMLVDSVASCARECDITDNCVGFWLNGPRAREDAFTYCRLMFGLWGHSGHHYEGNDCYLKKGLPETNPKTSLPTNGKCTWRAKALERLGLQGTRFTSHHLRRAYRKAALLLHPDRQKNHEHVRASSLRFAEVRNAFELLCKEQPGGTCRAQPQ